MTDNKRVKIAYIACIAVLIIQVIDVFFLYNQNSLFSTNVISRVVGAVVLIVLSGIFGLRLEKFCFKTYGWFFEILYGLLFSAVPIGLVYLFKYVYFHYRGYENLVLTFSPADIGVTNSSDEFTIAVIVYVVTYIIVAVFKEVFYRGFLISQLSCKYGVYKTILIQSVFYMISFLPNLIFSVIYGKFENQGTLSLILLVSAHLFYHMISGLKWGMFYKVNGTVWMSVVDHFVTDFVINSLFFTADRLPDKWYIAEIIVMQLLSIIIFIPFYKYRDKQNEMAATEFALSKEALKMGVDNFTPNQSKKAFNINFNPILKAKDSSVETEKNYEEPISLGEIQMPNEDDLTFSVRGYEIDDTDFAYDNEIADHDSNPSEKSQEFFDNLLGKSKDSAAATENSDYNHESSNAKSISELVKKYFDENFDKNTFN